MRVTVDLVEGVGDRFPPCSSWSSRQASTRRGELAEVDLRLSAAGCVCGTITSRRSKPPSAGRPDSAHTRLAHLRAVLLDQRCQIRRAV